MITISDVNNLEICQACNGPKGTNQWICVPCLEMASTVGDRGLKGTEKEVLLRLAKFYNGVCIECQAPAVTDSNWHIKNVIKCPGHACKKICVCCVGKIGRRTGPIKK